MNVRAVLDLDGLVLRIDKTPKLALQVVLGYRDIPDPARCWVIDLERVGFGRWRMGFKPYPTELSVAGLEARETVLVAIVKAIIASSPR
jgi:hypothetical protein